MIIYITEYDSSADSWSAAGRFRPIAVSESYAKALEHVPENMRQYVLRDHYYRISAWDTETGEKVEYSDDDFTLAKQWALAMGAKPE